MNQVAIKDDDKEIIKTLQSSLYPNAKSQSVALVLSYCRATGLDPMQKPVHIVPMWDSLSGEMKDVIMPGIGSYRVQAARAGCAGISEPEFGPEITESFPDEAGKGNKTVPGFELTYPAWCRITVKRVVNGVMAEFTAIERWKENYATAGKFRTQPNDMWRKRPYAQLAKCAEAQALRKGFPEIGSQPTAEEMEGKIIDMGMVQGMGSISATDGAIGRVENPDRKIEINEIGKVIQQLFDDGNEYGAFEEYVSFRDTADADEQAALWKLLDSKCRSSIKSQGKAANETIATDSTSV